ncbi:hypothetical protein GCM10010869_21650 [Mesorhizobium tianshanense]|uniref:Uncharacterized protein n=1 Tax=Mesorhizobium tianshanense TaxID=39844 RepID=A0A562M8H1_9HYPH|nr:hypothetical protein IQ26_07726 [Mesorhizobium tianshanense]GLS36575.1 hypothetical protein GCM10010869_21650 [Mesorhizobium tianshanense]
MHAMHDHSQPACERDDGLLPSAFIAQAFSQDHFFTRLNMTYAASRKDITLNEMVERLGGERSVRISRSASSEGSLSFVFRTCTCSDLVRTFHPTLTTTALYRSSSDWFETRS